MGLFFATGFEANSSTVEVSYGDNGFVRKTLGVSDNSGNSTAYPDVSEQVINGMTVTFKGDGETVYIAVWTYNNYAYTISIEEGVSAEEMTEYVLVTV